ncbi:hypothetical protein F2P81_019458 [Scophthalmus maximus]|uniref:Uncharacterized protein n=1 Tax=Scophthalmus maximus TaxID=52904 RepID=A0A6A4SBA6_SCOMX|nr:hypothetical protein F2P81_019458 [Scophthalmus maximus]
MDLHFTSAQKGVFFELRSMTHFGASFLNGRRRDHHTIPVACESIWSRPYLDASIPKNDPTVFSSGQSQWIQEKSRVKTSELNTNVAAALAKRVCASFLNGRRRDHHTIPVACESIWSRPYLDASIRKNDPTVFSSGQSQWIQEKSRVKTSELNTNGARHRQNAASDRTQLLSIRPGKQLPGRDSIRSAAAPWLGKTRRLRGGLRGVYPSVLSRGRRCLPCGCVVEISSLTELQHHSRSEALK